MSVFELVNRTNNYLRVNAKGKWHQSYRIKELNSDRLMHDLSGVSMLIRVNYPDLLGFFWMYNMSDALMLIAYVHDILHLEAHEIIVNDRIRLFYDIDMELTDDQLQDMVDYYEEYSGETGLTIDDVSRHLANLYFDATLASLEDHGNDLEYMQSIIDMMYTTRNRPIIGNSKFKISIHLITNIVCSIQECKSVVDHVLSVVLNHPDEYGLEYREDDCDMIISAIDVQPYHRFGSLAIHGGRKIVNDVEYINEITQYFQLKSESPYITRFDSIPINISFKDYNIAYNHNYDSTTTVSKDFIESVLSNVGSIPYYKSSDWDLESASYKGCTAIVKRLSPSYCDICARIHDVDNTLILVFNEKWGTGAWKCLHNRSVKSRIFYRKCLYDNVEKMVDSVSIMSEETYIEEVIIRDKITSEIIASAPEVSIPLFTEESYIEAPAVNSNNHYVASHVNTDDSSLLLDCETYLSDCEFEVADDCLPTIIPSSVDITIPINVEDLSDSDLESEVVVDNSYKYLDDSNIPLFDDDYLSDSDSVAPSELKKSMFDSSLTLSNAGVIYYQKREYIL